MGQINQEILLKDQRVIDEIRKHLWIESQKAGRDIGFDNAKADWLQRFAKVWAEYNMPEALTRSPSSAPQAAATIAPEAAKKEEKISIKRRRAKSYMQ